MEQGNAIVTALTTAFTTISGDLSTTMSAILPVAMSIVGMGIVIKFGIKWFQRITSKA